MGIDVAGRGIAITATELTKIYRNGPVEVHALRGVDFTALRGEFVVVLGPSGSGKSTFLNILGGIDSASAGSVLFNGQDITRLDETGLTRYRRDPMLYPNSIACHLQYLRKNEPSTASMRSGTSSSLSFIGFTRAKLGDALLADDPFQQAEPDRPRCENRHQADGGNTSPCNNNLLSALSSDDEF